MLDEDDFVQTSIVPHIDALEGVKTHSNARLIDVSSVEALRRVQALLEESNFRLHSWLAGEGMYAFKYMGPGDHVLPYSATIRYLAPSSLTRVGVAYRDGDNGWKLFNQGPSYIVYEHLTEGSARQPERLNSDAYKLLRRVSTAMSVPTEDLRLYPLFTR